MNNDVFPDGTFIGIYDVEGYAIHVGDVVECCYNSLEGKVRGIVKYEPALAAFKMCVTLKSTGWDRMKPCENCRIVEFVKE